MRRHRERATGRTETKRKNRMRRTRNIFCSSSHHLHFMKSVFGLFHASLKAVKTSCTNVTFFHDAFKAAVSPRIQPANGVWCGNLSQRGFCRTKKPSEPIAGGATLPTSRLAPLIGCMSVQSRDEAGSECDRRRSYLKWNAYAKSSGLFLHFEP